MGRDSRLSGKMLSDWLISSLVAEGINVTNFEMASTPAMFMACVTKGYEFDGSVMITASHLPFNRNGFKFFTKDGGLESANIKEILAYAERFPGFLEMWNQTINVLDNTLSDNDINELLELLIKLHMN